MLFHHSQEEDGISESIFLGTDQGDTDVFGISPGLNSVISTCFRNYLTSRIHRVHRLELNMEGIN